MIDVTQPAIFLETTAFFFLGIFGRYVLLCLVFQYLFKVRYKELFIQSEVNTKPRRPQQHWREIGHSLLTSFIFSLAGAGMIIAWQKGWTKVYVHWDDYPMLWLAGSVVVVLFLHETYYYWLHRWMHRPKVYGWVHRVHHDSITTSAWTSFSFHPTESVLQSLVLPLLLFVIPIHFAMVGLILVIMTASSIINHLNTEIYPQSFYRHWFSKWWIGATHHGLHHAQFRYNYGLYFTFWDKWMQTESPDFKRLFDSKTRKVVEKKS